MKATYRLTKMKAQITSNAHGFKSAMLATLSTMFELFRILCIHKQRAASEASPDQQIPGLKHYPPTHLPQTQ